MKMLYASIARELKLIFRNGISLYMTVAPALLAIVFIIIFGSIQSYSLTLAVDESIDSKTVTKLEEIAEIEHYESLEKLKARVEKPDSIAGIYMEDGEVRLIVEGNEGGGFAVEMQLLVGRALAGEGIDYHAEAVEPKGNLAYEISMISILLLALFIGGATVGLSIVSERESGITKAVAISPMRLASYVVTKLIPSLILGVAGILAAVLIMGKASDLPGFLLLVVCSILVCGLIIFTLGAFAKNQIAAIGVLKLLMPLALILPISAIFVPENWQFAYYIFPMYWQYTAIDAINDGTIAVIFSLLAFAVSIPWFIAAVLLFAKKTKMRIGR